MLENWERAGFGIYIHWPFCEAKCPYCDFNSHVSKKIDQKAWTNAYLREITNSYQYTSNMVLSTIFFGGGTPSLMYAETVHKIISHIKSLWKVSDNLEVTLEANPSSVETSKFTEYKSAGINRVSIGVQSLDNNSLKYLGRLHTSQEAISAIEVGKSTFDRVSFDLIYSRQHQSISRWEAELLSALSLGVTHISLYQLTIEDGTAFGDRLKIGRLPGLPSDDKSADMYNITQDIMADHGLPQYEISNHASLGEEAQHNLIYWRSGDYIGIGPGAHGRYHTNKQRLATVKTKEPNSWLTKVKKLGNGEESSSVLTKSDQALEYLLMSARLSEGVDLNFIKSLDLHIIDQDKLKSLIESGYIFTSKDRMFVTPSGRTVLNTILSDIIS